MVTGLETITKSKFSGNFTFVAGWGSVRFRGPQSNKLLEVSLKVSHYSSLKVYFRLHIMQFKKKTVQIGTDGNKMLHTLFVKYYVYKLTCGLRCGRERGGPA